MVRKWAAAPVAAAAFLYAMRFHLAGFGSEATQRALHVPFA